MNGLNQYTSAGPATFTHDPNGNLASTVHPGVASTSYVYDVENRLVSASGSHNATLTYDPLGRLWQVSGGASVRRLVYDGDALVAEYDSAGNMPHRYIHGNDSGDDPLIWYDNLASGWRRALLTDHQGSVIQVADMYGQPVATNSYDPWGIPTGTNAGRFGYTGQTWVPELGLWYYKARFYSPTTGRFLQVDPVGYKDQMNLYAYVGNDPVNHTDPTGETIFVKDEELRKRALTQINALTKSKYAFDSKGNLYRASATGGLGKSSYYDRRLMQGISARQTISVVQGTTIKTASGITLDVDNNCKGACTQTDKLGNSTITVSGNSSTIWSNLGMFKESPGEILMHEFVGHAIPRVAGSDTGNAVDNENKVRRENGLPLRPAEPDHSERGF